MTRPQSDIPSSAPIVIIGGGPAGLLLARLLSLRGIESVILESKSRSYVEQRQRAGILEEGTVQALREAKADYRMATEGIPHDGVELLFDRQRHRIDFPGLTDGRAVMIWPQTEVCKDLIHLLLDDGYPILFESQVTSINEVEGTKPSVTFERNGSTHSISCDYVAGCDGFWGISRARIPESISTTHDREFPFSWLGIMADAPPSAEDLIYARSPRGFALLSMRSSTVSRHYLQVPNDTDPKSWSDQAIWEELDRRVETVDGFKVNRGKITAKSVTPMRSFVHEPMQHGRLFLAGDAAHIVPPTGAKGLNLAVGDVLTLFDALVSAISDGSTKLLDQYSDTCLERVWQAERFSFETTSMLHTFEGASTFDNRLASAKLRRIATHNSAGSDFAFGYTGFDVPRVDVRP